MKKVSRALSGHILTGYQQAGIREKIWFLVIEVFLRIGYSINRKGISHKG
jgi:hypothetical protein